MNLSNVKEITIKELKSYFDHIGGYLLLVLFLGMLYFFFLKTFFLYGVVSAEGLFQMLPWVFVVFIPAITMGSFAEERDKETLEYLLTHPISATEMLWGKITGSWIFVVAGLLLTLPLTFFVGTLGNLDKGQTFAEYLGAIILSLVLVIIGVAISTFFKSQIPAFLTTATILFALNIISSDITAINLPVTIARMLGQLSIIDHFSSIARGILEIRDITYFVLVGLVGVTIAYINIQKTRLSNTMVLFKRAIFTAMFAFILGFVIIYSASYARGRFDLTSSKKYTLAPVTRDVLKEAGKIKIDAYASQDLPYQFQVQFNEVKNLLDDYQMAGGGDLSVNYFNPADHQDEIQKLGLTPIQFNVYGKDERQTKQGYLALVISNEDGTKQEKIPYVQDVNTLEYELTKRILKVKETEKQIIAFTSGNGEKSLYSEYTGLSDILDTDYTTSSVTLPSIAATETDDTVTANPETTQVPDLSKFKAIVIASPDNDFTDETKTALKDYLNNGGSIIYLPDTVNIDEQTLQAAGTDDFTGKLFSNLGITVDHNIVYDLRSNYSVPMNTPMGQIAMAYPFFISATMNTNAADVLSDIPQKIIAPWVSSLNIADSDKSNWDILYSTSQYSGAQTGAFTLDVQQDFANQTLQKYPLIAIRNINNGGFIAVLSTSRYFDDNYINFSPENSLLARRLFEKATQARNLSQIQAKDLSSNAIVDVSDTQKAMVKYVGPALSVVILVIVAAWRIIRRRQITKEYS